MEDKIVTGVPPMPSQPTCPHINMFGHEYERWCGDCGQRWPNNLHRHYTTFGTLPAEAKAKEPLSIWSCINCRKRVATACDFNINSRPNCVECNAEMEPFDDMKDKLKELEQDHNTAERARKRGLRTQPKPGEPGYQNKQE
jgi:hypothetical protein